MKALVLYEKRNGAAELREVPRPQVGPGDVLVRVKAAAVCGADIEFFRAEQVGNLRPPVVLGHEFCGVVEETGERVTEWRPGDRVVSDNTGYVCGRCYACSTGSPLLCPERLGLGYSMDGGFAEFVRIPEAALTRAPHSLMRLPDSLPFRSGAALEPSANAYRAVIQEGRLMPGEAVAIFGPGPMGLFSTQVAAVGGAAGILLFGTERSAARLELGRRLGATRTAEVGREDPEAVVREEFPEGADLVIDAAGAPTVLPLAMRLVRPKGRIVRVAWGNAPQSLDLDPLLPKGATIVGHFGYDYVSWRNVLRLAEQGRIQYEPLITASMPLERWREAFEMMESRRAVKVVFEW
ncbi:MAG: zinc-binding dehydrogenase [Spirochaetales bacterium]|nr:zinc-binding dehydrogenase [Spirochaetales bacterium]